MGTDPVKRPFYKAFLGSVPTFCLLEKAIDRLTEEYRSARVKHADETTWRCDGRNGYAWGFFTDDLSIYRFRESRGSKVALDVFGKKRHRLFQWVAHPEVPAENNLAERRLRPLVIARKLSFGSQSTDGLRIRETLLTVMDTLRLRWDDLVGKLMEAFEATAANPEADVTDILFPKKPAAGVGCLAERESAGVSRVRPIRTSTAVGLCPQPETAAEGSVLSRHIV